MSSPPHGEKRGFARASARRAILGGRASTAYFARMVTTMVRTAPVVHTASGTVEGLWQSKHWPDATVTEFATFRGIPFAKAPVGALRFDAPRAV